MRVTGGANLGLNAQVPQSARAPAPARGLSPGSILPPGNSHSEAMGWSARRCPIRTSPSRTISAAATKRSAGPAAWGLVFGCSLFHDLQCKQHRTRVTAAFGDVASRSTSAIIDRRFALGAGHSAGAILFSRHRRLRRPLPLWPKVAPAVLCRRFKQSRRGVHRECAARNLEHREVVN